MNYLVEIENGTGKTATKEYEAESTGELLVMVEDDLRPHPGHRIVTAWEKHCPERSIDAWWL